MRIVIGILGLCVVSTGVSAHHSFAAFYRLDEIVEIEGEITEIRWRNPHTLFSVRTANGDIVEVESNSVSVLDRMGVGADLLSVGDRIRVAGQPARRSPDQMFATNVLLSDGTEALFTWDAKPRWETVTLGNAEVWLSDGEGRETSAQDDGIFRVWITNVSNPEGRLIKPPDGGYPLTAEARASQARFSPDDDNPFIGCQAGMPRIMNAITPMEIIDRGGHVEINIELYDAQRLVWLDASTAPVPAPSFLGHSTGHWERDSLVVETNNINWPYFDQSGIPQSAALEITERFTPSADRNRLQYEMTVNDPETFTQPVIFSKYWTWRPGEEVRLYNCVRD